MFSFIKSVIGCGDLVSYWNWIHLSLSSYVYSILKVEYILFHNLVMKNDTHCHC